MTPPPHHAVEGDEINYQDYALVITGDVFRWMLNYAPLETLQRVGFINSVRAKITLTSDVDAGKNPDFCKDVTG